MSLIPSNTKTEVFQLASRVFTARELEMKRPASTPATDAPKTKRTRENIRLSAKKYVEENAPRTPGVIRSSKSQKTSRRNSRLAKQNHLPADSAHGLKVVAPTEQLQCSALPFLQTENPSIHKSEIATDALNAKYTVRNSTNWLSHGTIPRARDDSSSDRIHGIAPGTRNLPKTVASRPAERLSHDAASPLRTNRPSFHISRHKNVASIQAERLPCSAVPPAIINGPSAPISGNESEVISRREIKELSYDVTFPVRTVRSSVQERGVAEALGPSEANTARHIEKSYLCFPSGWMQEHKYRYIAEVVYRGCVYTTILFVAYISAAHFINHEPSNWYSATYTINAMKESVNQWLEPGKICWGDPNVTYVNPNMIRCREWRACPLAGQCANGQLLECANGFKRFSRGCKIADSLKKDVNEAVLKLKEKVVDYKCHDGPEPYLPYSSLNESGGASNNGRSVSFAYVLQSGLLNDHFILFKDEGKFGLSKDKQDKVPLPLSCAIQRGTTAVIESTIKKRLKKGFFIIISCSIAIFCIVVLTDYNRASRYKKKIMEIKMRKIALNYLSNYAKINPNMPVSVQDVQDEVMDQMGFSIKSLFLQNQILKSVWPEIEREITNHSCVKLLHTNVRGTDIRSWCWQSQKEWDETVELECYPEPPTLIFSSLYPTC